VKKLLWSLLALPFSVLAVEPVATTATAAAAPVASSGVAGQLTQLVLGLLLVLGLIFFGSSRQALPARGR
jgi:flagellar protein FliO/FliZ